MPPEELELFRIALRTRVATATSPGGAVSVGVTADGEIHRWQLSDAARRADPDRLVATVIELIGQARAEANGAVYADFGLGFPAETHLAHGLSESTAVVVPPAVAAPPVAVVESEPWDDDDDYHRQGRSPIAAD